MDRLSKVALILFVAAAVLGLYLWVATVWWPGYLHAIRLHMALGVVVLVLSVPVVAHHVIKTGSPLGTSLVVPAAVLAVLGWLCPERPEYPAFGPIGYAAWSTSAQLLLTALLARFLRRPEPGKPGVFGGVFVSCLAIYLLHVGLLGSLLRGDERWGAMMAHSAAGVAVTVFTVAHLPWLRDRLRWWRAPVVALAVAGLTWAWFATYPHDLILGDFKSPLGYGKDVDLRWPEARPGDLISMVPDSLEELKDPERDRLDPEIMGNSARCGIDGCHEVLSHQWEGSLHRMAVDNRHFKRVLGQMISELGPESAPFCASCHDPVASLAGTVVEDYASGEPPPSDGVSCNACHGTVFVPDDPHNGNLVVRQPRVYPGETLEERNALIRLDPRAHRQDLSGNFRMADGHLSCAPCHRMFVGPHMGASLTGYVPLPYVPPGPGEPRQSGLGCNDCHMPTLTIKRSFEQGLYDHYWTGTGWDLPLYASHPEADAEALSMVARHAVDFLGGRLDTRAFGRAELEHQVPFETVEEMKAVGVLMMLVAARQHDGALQVDVETIKHRAGHPFPTGSLDIKDFWQEVVVTDATGATVAHVGWVDDELKVDPDAHRLGATYYGAQDQPLYRHRVWELSAVRDKRTIPPGGSVTDHYTLEIPAEAVSPLTVRVGWRYRRINQVFADHVYGGGRTFPMHEIASASTQATWEPPEVEVPETGG